MRRARVRWLLATLTAACLALVVAPGNAPASSSTTGPSYGHFTDLCAKSASPASQSVSNTSGAATATVTSTLTKKEDYVWVWQWWYWVQVKSWGCSASYSAPDANDVAAAGVTVNWQVVSGPNTGKSGSGTSNSSGQHGLSYTNTAKYDGTDRVRITATRRWCERENTTLTTCASSYPSSMRSEVLTDDATVTWTGTPAPDTSFTVKPPSVTTDTTPTFEMSTTVPGSTYQCRVDGGAWAAATSPYTTATLSNGSHTVDCRAVAPSGVADPTPASYTFTVDATPPDTLITAGPPSPTNDNTPSFNVSSTPAGALLRCRVDGGAWVAGVETTGTYTTSALADGAHTVECQATGANGLSDPTPASMTVTVDTVAPNTSISGLPALTGQDSVTFTAASTEAGSTIQCRLDGPPWYAYNGPVTLTDLDDGSHTVECLSTDTAGNIDASPASQAFTVDTTVPDTSISGGPTGPTNDNTPSFNVASTPAGALLRCRVDGGAWQTGVEATGTYTAPTLADGSHTVECQATGANGLSDPTPASRTVTIDTVAPNTSISGLPALTGQNSVTFTAASTEQGSTIKCRLDGQPWFDYVAATTLSALANGQHTVQCVATDAAGNADASPASQSFTVDTTVPDTLLSGGPSGPTNDNTPSFNVASTPAGALLRCRVDGGAWQTGVETTGTYTAPALADGAHAVECQATGANGLSDPTPATMTVTIDTVAPNTSISGLPVLTGSDSVTFTAASTEPGSTIQCRFDGPPWSAYNGPVTLTDLDDGSHTVECLSTDTAGNIDATPASHTFTVDTTVPDTLLSGGPTGPTNDNTPAFNVASTPTGAALRCRVDGGTWETGVEAASEYTTPALTDGAHTVECEATGANGLPDPTPATATVTVDTVAPNTTISGLPAVTYQNNVHFTAASSEPGSAIRCRADGEPWFDYTSLVTLTNLTVGQHKVECESTDVAGNVDPTPVLGLFEYQLPPVDPPADPVAPAAPPATPPPVQPAPDEKKKKKKRKKKKGPRIVLDVNTAKCHKSTMMVRVRAVGGRIKSVSGWIDSTFLGTDGKAPFKENLKLDAFANGSHTLKIKATMRNGKRLTAKKRFRICR